MKRSCLDDIHHCQQGGGRHQNVANNGNVPMGHTSNDPEYLGNFCFFPLPNCRAGNDSASDSSASAACILPRRKKLATASKDPSPDSIIAEELNKLTIAERDSVYNDIHGVTPEVDEAEWFIDHCLTEMEAEMKRLSGETSAYSKALFLNRAYVKDRQFELMFLRADCYDWGKAARRLAFHFQKKLELYGIEKLTKHITWSDLGEDSVNSLAQGATFFFPGRKDRSGRALYIGFYSARLNDPASVCHMRGVWYTFMSSLIRDEEAQRKGVTTVFFTHGATVQDYMDQMSIQIACRWMTRALPFRLSAVHLCTQNDILQSIKSIVVNKAPTFVRTRIRVHCGSLLECMYDLNTYGIETKNIPFLAATGERDLGKWKTEFEKLKADDERRFPTEDGGGGRITIIRDADVLVGKGYPFQNHPGTKAMMKFVETLIPEYDASRRGEKPVVASRVVEEIKQLGGRFLRKIDDGSWVEVDDSAARSKAAMGFRNLKRKSNK